jgi:hypothetical protein
LVRLTNLLLLLAVLFGAVWLDAILVVFLGGLPSAGTFHSVADIVLKDIVPHALVSYVAVAVAGAILSYFVNSAVPLMWCFVLGFICLVAKLLLFYSSSVGWILVNTLLSLGLLVAPVASGYWVKRITRSDRRSR